MQTRHCAMLTVLATMAGCGRQPATPAGVPASAPAAQQWLGTWTGPEGTWLQVDRTGAGYSVTIRNLDAARTFPGTATAEGITFERDGVRENLRATDGPGTGMKWLAEKSNCLTVKAGEGYCRD
jgi:hypothetical protein